MLLCSPFYNNFIAISDTFKEMLVTRGFKPDEIYTVYNGIDVNQKIEHASKEEFLNRYNIDYKDKTIVGIIARLDKVKDHETFIRAAEILIKRKKNIIFLIAGDGNDEKRLMALVEELGLQDYVHFLGFVKDQYSFLNAIDINTLTSLSESFPYAILEGALMKKPIISTDVGGLRQLVDQGENGYLVDVGDVEDLANRIDEISLDKNRIKEMGEKLYKKVEEKFSSDTMAREHVKIYEKIIK